MTDTAKDESKYIAEGGGAEREGKGQAETTDTLKSNILQRQRGGRETETYAYALKCR